MHPVANHLIQLQDLILIRDEQRAHKHIDHLDELDGAISTMTGELPPETAAHFNKLYKKDHLTMVPVVQSVCAACGMSLPISLVQAVRQEKDLHNCPNCARFLYFPENLLRRKPIREPRFGPRKVGVSRFSSVTLMMPRINAVSLDDTISLIAKRLEDEGYVEDGGQLAEAALQRESMFSTVVGHGLAFPHVRNVEGGGLALALATSAKPLAAECGDRQSPRIVFFMSVPTAANAFYLKLLSGLTETFSKPEARKVLLAAKDDKELWKTLNKLTRSTIK